MQRIVPTLTTLALITSLQSVHAQQLPAHPKADPGVPRDKNGSIKRSSTAREQFMRQSGYPHGRAGYVIDHVIPLAKGGKDAPGNMQWQTREAAKAKDRTELGQTPKSSHSTSVHSATPRAPRVATGTKSAIPRGGFGSSARSSAS